MPREYKMYINGEWVDALDGERYDDYNPYTGEVFARVPSGKRADARRAIDAALDRSDTILPKPNSDDVCHP